MVQSSALFRPSLLSSTALFLASFGLVRPLQSAVTVVPVQRAFSHGETAATTLGASFNQDSLVLVDSSDPGSWLHGASASPWTKTWQAGNASGNLTNWGKVGWVIFDLGSVQTELDMMYLWNVTENNGAQTQRGMNTFNIWYANSPTLPGSSISNVNYSFDSFWTQYGGTQTLARATNTPDSGTYQYEYDGAFDISGINSARYIAFEILTNHGSGMGTPNESTNRVGLGEVVFTATPEPSRSCLLLIGILTTAMRRKRSRRA